MSMSCDWRVLSLIPRSFSADSSLCTCVCEYLRLPMSIWNLVRLSPPLMHECVSLPWCHFVIFFVRFVNWQMLNWNWVGKCHLMHFFQEWQDHDVLWCTMLTLHKWNPACMDNGTSTWSNLWPVLFFLRSQITSAKYVFSRKQSMFCWWACCRWSAKNVSVSMTKTTDEIRRWQKNQNQARKIHQQIKQVVVGVLEGGAQG